MCIKIVKAFIFHPRFWKIEPNNIFYFKSVSWINLIHAIFLSNGPLNIFFWAFFCELFFSLTNVGKDQVYEIDQFHKSNNPTPKQTSL